MQNWRQSLLDELKGLFAPRVLSFSELASFADRAKPGVGETAVRRLARSLEEFGVLVPVRKGLWLNAAAVPSPSMAEAAPRMRTGAVVSLQTVLGDAGVLNNFSSQVYSVVPVPERGTNPLLGSHRLGDTVIHFRGVKQSVLEAGEPSDRLSPLVPYPRATAEAALVHWLHLAHTRSSMQEPDTQCDVSVLDIERLSRLASATGLLDRAMGWVERCRQRGEMDDEDAGWKP